MVKGEYMSKTYLTPNFYKQVEEYKEFEKEEVATRKRRSTIESRENATVEAENVEKEIKKSFTFEK